MKFAEGDEVVWLRDGQEIPATVLNCGKDHQGAELYQIDLDGQTKHVNVNEILPSKKPGFEVRDLAFFINETRDAIEGEIVAVGVGPQKRKFLQLKFAVGEGVAREWFSEDEVFIVSDPEKRGTPKASLL